MGKKMNENLMQNDSLLMLAINNAYTNMTELSPSSAEQQNYAATKTLDATVLGQSTNDTGDQLAFTLTKVMDLAGNTVTTNNADGITSTTNGSIIVWDTKAPTVRTATMTTSQLTTGYATVGDDVILSIDIPDGPVFLPTVQFAGDNNTYVNATTVTGTAESWTIGDFDAGWENHAARGMWIGSHFDESIPLKDGILN